ncbi:hypothetical protein [Escherichia coli]|nr:hypothetical protein [Escherichia coli]
MSGNIGANPLIGIVEHHIAVGNIESMENEQPDFEFDPYILEEF